MTDSLERLSLSAFVFAGVGYLMSRLKWKVMHQHPPHTVMILNNSRKVRPGLTSEFPDYKSSLGLAPELFVRC